MIKKVICLFSFWYLTFGACFAAPVGNPAGSVLLEGNYPTKFSLEAETVFNRKLKSGSYGSPKFSGVFYTGKLSLYVGNKLDIYGLVGVYEGKIKNFINDTYIIDTKTDAVLGLGVNYVLHEWEFLNGILRVGADAKYRQFKPDIDDVRQWRVSTVTTDEALSFKEWQIALGLAYQYKKFIPYAGMKYSDMGSHIKFKQNAITYSDSSLCSKNVWGLFYGADVLVDDNISFNIEGRNIDENALNAGLNVRF